MIASPASLKTPQTSQPQFSRLNTMGVANRMDRGLKSDVFSKDRKMIGSLPDFISRMNMVGGKYIPEQIIAVTTGMRFWETLARNVLTWCASIAVTAWVKDEKYSLNSLLFDRFMVKQSKMQPLSEGAGILDKIKHGWKKWLNSWGIKEGNYFDVLEGSGFVHKVPQDKKDLGKSYWRSVMDANLIEHLTHYSDKIEHEEGKVISNGKKLKEEIIKLNNYGLSEGDRQALTSDAEKLINEGDKISDIIKNIENKISKFKTGNVAGSGINTKHKLKNLPVKALDGLKQIIADLSNISSKTLTHKKRRMHKNFTGKIIKRINHFSTLSSIVMTLINTGTGIFSFWLAFRSLAPLDKEFDAKTYQLSTQKGKRKKYFDKLLNQKPVNRLPARLVRDRSYNFSLEETSATVKNGKIIVPQLPLLTKQEVVS